MAGPFVYFHDLKFTLDYRQEQLYGGSSSGHPVPCHRSGVYVVFFEECLLNSSSVLFIVWVS